jgi:hypothetical protein
MDALRTVFQRLETPGWGGSFAVMNRKLAEKEFSQIALPNALETLSRTHLIRSVPIAFVARFILQQVVCLHRLRR